MAKGNGSAIYEFIMNKNKYAYDVSLYQLFYHISAFKPALLYKYKQFFKKKEYGVRNRVNFNEYGDMIGHLKLENEDFFLDVKSNSTVCDIDYSQIEIINNFVNIMNRREVNVYIVFPVISYTSYNKDKECNDKIVNIINAQFKSITISNNNRYVFKDNLFFHAPYHVDSIGRELRMNYMIKDLHNILIKTNSRLGLNRNKEN
jgi:hypothetical protein